MTRAKRPVFDSSGPFVARKYFRFAGIIYNHGDLFDHDKVDYRSLRQLYNARRIDFCTEESDKKVNDWRNMSDKNLLKYAFEVTGTRFRKVERARKVLGDLS